jgi:hypothetical protein
MELLDRYLQAVRFWLPKSHQEDIIAELSSDLHSQIEERETELGRPLNEAEMEAILTKSGNPILVASRYRPPTQLIGPALFPIYQFVLKVVMLWILVPVFLFIVGPSIIFSSSHRVLAALQTFGNWVQAEIFAAAIITVVFALLERTQARLKLVDKWDIRSLPPVPKKPQPPSRTQSVFELVFGIIGLIWILLVPYFPFLILGPAAAFLNASPIWHTFYLPIVLLGLLGLARDCFSIARPDLPRFPAFGRLVSTALNLLLLHFLLNAAAHAPHLPGGDWAPFVMLKDAARDSAQYKRLAAIVNVSILISLALTWIGLAIAAVIQTWECLRQFGGRGARACNTALLRFL